MASDEATADPFGDLKKESTSRAEESTEDKPETWNSGLEAGDLLEGYVIKGDYVMTGTGKAARLLVIKEADSDKEWTVWCSSKMLLDALLAEAPAKGSPIVIEFHGKFPVTSAPDRHYNKFTLVATDHDFEYWKEIHQRYRNRAEASASSAEIQTADGDDSFRAPKEAPW